MDFDTDNLAKIIGNLLMNVLQFAEAQGHICVYLSAEQGHLVIKIRDTKMDVAPEQFLLKLNRVLQNANGGKDRDKGPRRESVFTKENESLRKEDRFLQQMTTIIEHNIDDESFGIPQLLREMGVSRTQMHNKVKALTGQSTSQIIRSIRLEKAKALLESTDLNVSEVSGAVGFKNLAHFSASFSEEFGLSPSAVRKMKKS